MVTGRKPMRVWGKLIAGTSGAIKARSLEYNKYMRRAVQKKSAMGIDLSGNELDLSDCR